MKSIFFDRWCSAAVGRIRFVPDRWEVYEELYAHMEDQYEELTAGGMGEKEAEAEVVSAMGDPEETARQLERIHRPFWGYGRRRRPDPPGRSAPAWGRAARTAGASARRPQCP